MARIKFLNTHIDSLTMDEAIYEINKLIQAYDLNKSLFED